MGARRTRCRDRDQTENGAVTSAALGAPTRGIGPLRLALAGATRSGSAGVGSLGSRSAGEATPHSSGVNWKGQLILGRRLSPNRASGPAVAGRFTLSDRAGLLRSLAQARIAFPSRLSCP